MKPAVDKGVDVESTPVPATSRPSGDQAKVSIMIAVTPAQAFEVFTRDINLWWRRGPRFRNDRGDRGLICLEPGLGGRVFESLRSDDNDNETVVELGRITIWEPPQRLLMEWRNSNFAGAEKTEVEVLFEARTTGTLVTVMHRGWSQLRADHPARHGMNDQAFLRMMGLWWADLLRSLMELVDRL